MTAAAPMERQAASEALAQLVEYLLAHAADRDDLGHLIAALDIVQMWCWENVRLGDIPEPTGMDAVRMALAASVIERLVGVYSAPPHNQPQRAPAWCAKVPPSPVKVWLVSPTWADGAMLNSIFTRRDFIALENFFAFA